MLVGGSTARGYARPFLVGYANGRLDYLPEPRAYDEGGYEVTYPYYMGISRHLQARVWKAVEAAVEPVVPSRVPDLIRGH